MDKKQALSKIEPVFRKVMEEHSVPFTEKLTSADVEPWDSMNNVELILAVEEELNVKFDADEILGLSNIGALAEVVAKKTEEGKG